MKIVLDTNVLISSLFWYGMPHKLLRLIERGYFTLCVTPLLLKELMDVLTRPRFFRYVKEHSTSIEELLTSILDIAELHSDKKIFSVVKDDPADDVIISCAVNSGAKYIITGDTHLLNLKTWSGISILNPRQFLKLYNL